MPYDVLNEPLVEAAEGEAPIALTLPGLFAAWGQGRDVLLRGIRRHQRAAMYMFLSQLGAAAWLRAEDGEEVEASDEIWRERLLRIAPDSAWHLVQNDDTVPALLQAPVLPGETKGFKSRRSPDNLSILFAAKNHALKQSQIGEGSPWMWLASLVELQTMGGFGGRDNYGVVRMNGGQASRPMVAVYPDMREGPRWVRDITAIRNGAETLRGAMPEGFYAEPGKGLVATWLQPWDGVSQIALHDLDPLFVEVARRIRLRDAGDGRIEALVGNSKAARIAAAKDLCGRTGDPWAPLDGETKVLTVPAEGWNVRRLKNLIAPDASSTYRPSFLQRFQPGEARDMFFHAAVVTGGQGKTEGFHEVTIPIPGRVVGRLSARIGDAATNLGNAATGMLADAEKTASILRRAILCCAQGGPALKDIKADKREADAWVAGFQAAFSDAFFPALWTVFDLGGDRTAWRDRLRQEAEAAYETAAHALPVRGELFYRAYTRGRSVLFGLLNKEFSVDQANADTKEVA